MNAWTLTLLCPTCDGGNFDVVAAPRVYRTEAAASHQCRTCGAEWAIRIEIAKVPRTKGPQ